MVNYKRLYLLVSLVLKDFSLVIHLNDLFGILILFLRSIIHKLFSSLRFGVATS